MLYSQIIGIPGAPGAVGVNESPQDNSIALLGATTAAMNLYVDPVAGLDTNPGTAALPFRTIAAALAAVPRQIQNDVVINLATGDYAEPLIIDKTLIDSSLQIIGTRVLSAGEVQRTASIFSANTIGTAAAGWGVDANIDKYVEIVDGKGVGQVRQINYNTADTITVLYPWATTPDGTSKYEVRVPGSRIIGTRPRAYHYAGAYCHAPANMGSSGRGILLSGIEITAGKLFVTDTNVCLAVVTARKGIWVVDGGYLRSNGTFYLNNSTTVTYYGGFYTHDDGISRMSIQAEGGASIDITGATLAGGGLFKNCMLSMYKLRFTAGTTPAWELLLQNVGEDVGSALHAIKVDGIDKIRIIQSSVTAGGLDATGLTSVDGAIQVSYGSVLHYDEITGTGNAGVGVRVFDSSHLDRTTSGFATTITGLGGDFKVGNRPVGTWAGRTTYGPDDDGADQKLVRAVPANPGPWTIALGVALNGMLASGLVRVHDLTSGAVLAEVAPAPGAGQFSVDYATGVVTFNTLQQTDLVAIYYRPVSYTGARIG